MRRLVSGIYVSLLKQFLTGHQISVWSLSIDTYCDAIEAWSVMTHRDHVLHLKRRTLTITAVHLVLDAISDFARRHVKVKIKVARP